MRPGIFAFPRHRDLIPEITRLQPSLVKAFASVTSNDWWKRVREVSPASIRVLVHGEVSDNPDLGNPNADANTTAMYLDGKPDVPRLVILKNEPSIWDGAEKRKAVTDYTVAWLARAHQLGMNGVVEEFNSGWPRVSLLDDEDWEPEFASIDAAMNVGDYIGRHQYWGKAGPLAWWPFTVGRQLRCPTTHNILIDECGFDGNTDGLGYNQGWAGVLTEDQYVDHIIQYDRMLASDPRVKGMALFVCDYDNNHWSPFDTWPLMDRIIARLGECDTVLPEVVMPTRLHLPVASYGYISQTFAQHKANNPKGGWGLDFSCNMRTPVLAASGGVVDKVLDYGTASYGKMTQVNHYWGFTRSGHLDTLPLKKGDGVTAGEPIAFSGNTGDSTGPHLHFEIIPFANRVWPWRVDPSPLLGIGGPIVPPPPTTTTPAASPVTPADLAKARLHASAYNLFDRLATALDCKYRGDEWEEGGYTLTTVQRNGTNNWITMKCPTGHWLETLVTFGTP